MRYRKLGQTGLEVSSLSFGAWQIGDPEYWGADDRADAEAAVQTAIDLGINLFDTAEAYGDGEAERRLGHALGARRKDVYIASKAAADHCAPDQLKAACEGSLTRLGTDYLDLYQVHWPCRDVPMAETYGALQQLKEEGKIREIGLSNFGPEDLDSWFTSGTAVSNQVGYNILFRSPEYGVIPASRRRKLGLLAYMPLMQGLLSGRWEWIADIPLMRRRTRHFSNMRNGTRHGEAGAEEETMAAVRLMKRIAEQLGLPMANMCLAWVLAQPGITSAIIGARNPEQLKSNTAAADIRLGPGLMAQLNEFTAPLKRHMGQNADMWMGGDDSRIR